MKTSIASWMACAALAACVGCSGVHKLDYSPAPLAKGQAGIIIHNDGDSKASVRFDHDIELRGRMLLTDITPPHTAMSFVLPYGVYIFREREVTGEAPKDLSYRSVVLEEGFWYEWKVGK